MLTSGRYQTPLKERFARVPFVQYNKGDSWGYVAFDKALTEEDVSYIKEKLSTLGSKLVTWSFLDGMFPRIMIGTIMCIR